MLNSHRATRALIHLDYLAKNLQQIRKSVNSKVKLCLAIKADAYGHGSIQIAKEALKNGVDQFAVSNVDEGVQLRKAGVQVPIILLGYASFEEFPHLIEYKLEPFVGDISYLKELENFILNYGTKKEHPTPLIVHLKIDTGMGRLGCPPKEALGLAMAIKNSPVLKQGGLCTHFAVSDSPHNKKDRQFTKKQLEILLEVKAKLEDNHIKVGLCHAANSGGILYHKESHLDMVRVGLAAYGYGEESLTPVMELESEVTFVKKLTPHKAISYGRTWKSPKETQIATIPIGYADGYPRALSNRASVLIKGDQYPIVGRICMDQLMVDVGMAPIKRGDKVTLFSYKPQGLNAEDLAQITGTISYEICCGISKRVPRIYLKSTSLK